MLDTNVGLYFLSLSLAALYRCHQKYQKIFYGALFDRTVQSERSISDPLRYCSLYHILC